MTTKASILSIKKLLRLRMNGDVATSLRKSGMPYRLIYGLDAPSLRDVAGRFTADVELAETLWKEQARESKILATLLYPREVFDAAKAELWLNDCFTTELVEQLIFNLLQHLPYAADLATAWINSPLDERRSAGYVLTLRLLLSKQLNQVAPDALIKARTDKSLDLFPLSLHATRLLDRCEGL